jgi:hypothetical protein
MDRPTYLVISCQWCGATTAAHIVEKSDPAILGETIIDAAKSGKSASLRRSAPAGGGFPIRPCWCDEGRKL